MTPSTPAGNSSFWGRLPRPIYALAPMADVTDAAYRRLIARLGKPHVMFTEFVSADGLCSPGRDNLMHHLIYDPTERPIAAQIFSARPERVYDAARLLADLQFDGIDINMGCPDKNVCRQGAGSSLMRNPGLAQEIFRAAQEGGRGLPVSVKTRTGYNSPAVAEWIGFLLEVKPAAITVHLRTRKEMSKVPARWEYAREAVELARGTGTLILGNGDVRDLDHADELVAETGVDGVMLGRAALGNPWLFNRRRGTSEIPLQERVDLAIEHARLFEELSHGRKNYATLRKYLRTYFAGLPGASEVRAGLDAVNCPADVRNLLDRLGFSQSSRPPNHDTKSLHPNNAYHFRRHSSPLRLGDAPENRNIKRGLCNFFHILIASPSKRR